MMIKQKIDAICTVLERCKILSDAYMIDFYVDDFWAQLPEAWRDLSLGLKDLLDLSKPICGGENVAPLGLLALRSAVRMLAIDRNAVVLGSESENIWNCLKGKKIKRKKRHEIERIVQFLAKFVGNGADIEAFVDVGSGLGHLSRILTLETGITVHCIERNHSFVSKAQSLDSHLTKFTKSFAKPNHQCQTLQLDSNSRQNFSRPYCLLGLHACGDLSAAIIKKFASDPDAKMLLSFGCCYMKLNGGLDKKHMQIYPQSRSEISDLGYPMSSYLRSKSNHDLSYSAREMACHAIEQYNLNFPPSTGAHCSRAILEWLIVKLWPEKRHLQLKIPKACHLLEWPEYLAVILAENPQISQVSELLKEPKIADFVSKCLTESYKCSIFYELRLLIAPLIESLILYDRVLYLNECGFDAQVIALFDPKLSARNLAIVARK